jgi:hypothetical protein
MFDGIPSGLSSNFNFAASLAANKTAQAVKQGFVGEIKAKIDRPTPFALNSIAIRPATKEYPNEASVWLKKDTEQAMLSEQYLGPQIYGGKRLDKRFESALKRVGVMPQSLQAVIPESESWAADIDQYGNLKASQIVQIISYFQAFGEVGYRANMSARRKGKIAAKQGATIGGREYFAVLEKARGGLPPGIWAKRGTHGVDVAPVILFVSPARYRKRLEFDAIHAKICAETFPKELDKALAYEMATRK